MPSRAGRWRSPRRTSTTPACGSGCGGGTRFRSGGSLSARWRGWSNWRRGRRDRGGPGPWVGPPSGSANALLATTYPEPKYDYLARARILHVFRDRGEHEEPLEMPFDFSRTPAPAAVG